MRTFLLGILLLVQTAVVAADLDEGKVYRLDTNVYGLQAAGNAADKKQYIALKDFKFRVLDSTNQGHYIVRFVAVYEPLKKHEPIKDQIVRNDESYKIQKKLAETTIEKSVSLSRSGLVSGPLIVPFKYRTDDDSITGDATLGYYAGISFEPRLIFTEDYKVPITPFISGGLSQISVADDDETDVQTGITIAVGILIQNWDGINLGLVYGEDRVGDSDWEHEGEGWVSFMIGWELEK